MTTTLYNYITSFSSSLYDYIYKENEKLTRCLLKQDKDIQNYKKDINDKNKELIELQLIIFNKEKEIESYHKKLKDINNNYNNEIKKIKDLNDYIVILWDTINIKDKEIQKITKIKTEMPLLLCSICLDEIDETNKIETKCNHLFHKNCLDKWERNTCPNCRSFL